MLLDRNEWCFGPHLCTCRLNRTKADLPLTRLNGRGGKRARPAARQNLSHCRVQTRPNAQERAGDVVTLFWTVLRSCNVRSIPANGLFYIKRRPTFTCRNRYLYCFGYSSRAPFKYRMYSNAVFINKDDPALKSLN